MNKKYIVLVIVIILVAAAVVWALTSKQTTDQAGQQNQNSNQSNTNTELTGKTETYEVAFIKGVFEENGAQRIEVDYAEFISGPGAKDAAFADGLCPDDKDACAPNDFYVRNKEQTTSKLTVSKTATVSVISFDAGDAIEDDISYATFKARRTLGGEGWDTRPFKLEVSGGSVTSIKEVYIP